jgi:LacI family transcriptional regulator
VVHGKPNVTPEIQKKVLAALVETGYVANTQARALRTLRTSTIGVVPAQITNPFYAELIDALAQSLTLAG